MELSPSLSPEPLVPKHFSDLLTLVEDLLLEDAQLLLEQEHKPPIGVRRDIKLGQETENPTTIVIALYDPAKRQRQARVLGERGHEVESPVGHVQLNMALANAEVACSVYLQEDEQVKVYVDCSVKDTEELTGEDSEACGDLLEKALGAGYAVWTKGFIYPGERTQQVSFDAESQAVRKLTGFLTTQTSELANMQ